MRHLLGVVLVAVSAVTSAADVRFCGKGSLQEALDAGAGGKVTIAKGSWNVAPSFVHAGTEIVFEGGAELVADPNGFFGINDCVLNVHFVSNVVIRGGSIRMWREDYLAKKDGRPRSQWRHGISIRASSDVKVEGVRLFECGGDGIYIADLKGVNCRNITVRDSLMSRGLRQGMSVIDVEGLLLENCTFERTLGENPQAGIDFEPNTCSNRMKGIVVRNCRFIDNVRKGINLHLDSLDATSEPIDFLFENCICISNAIGFGLCFNSKENSFPKGNILVRDCQFSTSWEQGIDLTQKPLDAVRVEFKDVVVEDSCIRMPELGDVHMQTHYAWDNPPDGIRFDGLTVKQTRKGRWLTVANASRRKLPVCKLGGKVTIVSPNGNTRKITLSKKWAASAIRAADGQEIVPVPAPDWKSSAPARPKGVVGFESVRLRGHLNFAFYVDKPRKVLFRCGLSAPASDADRSADIVVYAFGDLKRKMLSVRPKQLSDAADICFDAPAKGWYVLYANPGRNGFIMGGSDAPVLFSLGKHRRFDPEKPVISLPEVGFVGKSAADDLKLKPYTLYEVRFAAEVSEGVTLERYPALETIAPYYVSRPRFGDVVFPAVNWRFVKADGSAVTRPYEGAAGLTLMHSGCADHIMRFYAPEEAVAFKLAANPYATGNKVKLGAYTICEIPRGETLNINPDFKMSGISASGWQLVGGARFVPGLGVDAACGHVISDPFPVESGSVLRVRVKGAGMTESSRSGRLACTMLLLKDYEAGSTPKGAVVMRDRISIEDAKVSDRVMEVTIPEGFRWARCRASGGMVYEYKVEGVKK